MSRLTLACVRSDGATFRVDDSTWGVVKTEGLDKPPIELYTQKRAMGDGDIVTATRMGSREIKLEIKTKRSDLNEILRRDLMSYFRIGMTYDLYVYRYGDTRMAVECTIDSVEIPTQQQMIPITAKITLICPDGYMQSVDSYGKNIASYEKRAGMPWISTIGYGRIYGVIWSKSTVLLENDGDADAYMSALVVPTSAVTGVKIKISWLNADGNEVDQGFVKYVGTLAPNDRLIINGERKTITKNGVSAMNMIHKDSDFAAFALKLGTSTAMYECDTENPVMSVNIYYRKRYMGA